MKIGNDEGDRCNRPNDDGFACDGSMELPEVENCTCHISSPCGACFDCNWTCTVCGAVADA